MPAADISEALGYRTSPHFLSRDDVGFAGAPGFGHIFRKAADTCRLHGVYALSAKPAGEADAIIPVVYVCDAESEAQADEIHRRVWNQDVAPFLIVQTPRCVRLYSGFRYARADAPGVRSRRDCGVLAPDIPLAEIADGLEALNADSIDSARVWEVWGKDVTPDTRVDWTLLDNLARLSTWLREGGLTKDTAHSLIGKFG